MAVASQESQSRSVTVVVVTVAQIQFRLRHCSTCSERALEAMLDAAVACLSRKAQQRLAVAESRLAVAQAER